MARNLVFKSLLLFSTFLLIKCEQSFNLVESNDNNNILFLESIPYVLKHLNENANRIYNYREAKILTSQQKADSIELNLEINVDCLNNNTDTPCKVNSVECNTYLKVNEHIYKVVRINCEPQPDNNEQVSSTSNEEYIPSHSIQQENNKINSKKETILPVEEFIGDPQPALCLGCNEPIKVNGLGVKTFSDLAIKHLESESKYKFVVLQVLSAHRQIVNGVNYRLVFEIARTNCLKATEPELKQCVSTPGSFICEIKYYESYGKDKGKKITSNNCTESQTFENTETTTAVYHEHEVDENSQLSDFLRELEAQILPRLESNLDVSIVDTSPTEQDGAGLIPSVSSYPEVSATEDQPVPLSEHWLMSEKSLKSEEGVGAGEDASKTYDQIILSRRRRELLLGGVTPININDPTIQKFVKSSLNRLESTNGNKPELIEVLSASKQVVAGYLYRIKIKIGPADCAKTVKKEADNCGSSQTKICDVKVLDRAWLHESNVNVTCDGQETISFTETEKRAKRSLDSVDTSEYSPMLSILRRSLESYPESKANEKRVLKKVLSVTEIVADVFWNAKAQIVHYYCSKNESSDSSKGCVVDKRVEVCYFYIWNKPWEYVKSTCIFGGRRKDVDVYLDSINSDEGDSRIQMNKRRASVILPMFTQFLKRYNKIYETREEYQRRYEVFDENWKHVEFLNGHEQGTAVYGMSKFADLTPKEFSIRLGYRRDLRSQNEVPFEQAEIPDVVLPGAFDWREKGAVSEVKNQGQCGSCWAFSVTGNVEGQNAIKSGQMLELSEQELVDCDTTDDGCNGGLMDNAYRMIEKLGGLETEKDYPYESEREKCSFKKELARVQLSGAVNISQNETEMAQWLVQNGPISIAINANAMQFYMGGVSHPFKFLCNPKSLDHGVLIVGYGVHTYPKFKKSLPYWIVKNSWGKSWGEQGYYRVYRGDGTCGVNQTPSSGIVA